MLKFYCNSSQNKHFLETSKNKNLTLMKDNDVILIGWNVEYKII